MGLAEPATSPLSVLAPSPSPPQRRLHGGDGRAQERAEWSAEDLLELVQDPVWDRLPEKKHATLVRKVVAVVRQKVVRLWREAVLDILQEVPEHVGRNLGVPERDDLDRVPCGGEEARGVAARAMSPVSRQPVDQRTSPRSPNGVVPAGSLWRPDWKKYSSAFTSAQSTIPLRGEPGGAAVASTPRRCARLGGRRDTCVEAPTHAHFTASPVPNVFDFLPQERGG